MRPEMPHRPTLPFSATLRPSGIAGSLDTGRGSFVTIGWRATPLSAAEDEGARVSFTLGHLHTCHRCGRRWVHDFNAHGDAARNCALPSRASCLNVYPRHKGEPIGACRPREKKIRTGRRSWDKQAAYRDRMQTAGLCPHCGKPCAPFSECEERRERKRLLRIWRTQEETTPCTTRR